MKESADLGNNWIRAAGFSWVPAESAEVERTSIDLRSRRVPVPVLLGKAYGILSIWMRSVLHTDSMRLVPPSRLAPTSCRHSATLRVGVAISALTSMRYGLRSNAAR